MKKRLVLPIGIEIVRYPKQTVLELLIDSASLRDWCLGLCLLNEGLIEAFIVREETGVKSVEMRTLVSPSAGAKAYASLKGEVMVLEIKTGDLGYLLHFFLKYYRDCVAEVDHVDLEASSRDGEPEEMYLTFKVPDSLPPVDAREAKRRLGAS